MIFYEQPTDPWIPFDFMLIEAYQRLQDEICPKCGHPVWLCRSKSNNIFFEVKTSVCYAERALKEAEVNRLPSKDRSAALKDKKHWGEFHYTVPARPPQADGDFPTRTEYYQEMSDPVELDNDPRSG